MPLGPLEARSVLQQRLHTLLGKGVLSDKGIARLSYRLRSHQYAAGETLVKRGVRGDFMAVLASGQIAVYSGDDQEQGPTPDQSRPTVVLLPGSTFGEAMVVDGRMSGSTLRAITDVEIYVLRRDDFQSIAAQKSLLPGRRRLGRWGWLALAAVVALLAATVLAVYAFTRLGPVWRTPPEPEPGATPAMSRALEVMVPQHSPVLQFAPTVPVRTVASQPGFYQAQLFVDGVSRGVEINRETDVVPWVVDWVWDGVALGPHQLAVQMRELEGAWKVSLPVTVTVVPEGMLALASKRDGSPTIFAMQTDGASISRLVEDSSQARQPAWSRDGTLAYVAGADRHDAVIRLKRTGAGQPTPVTTGRDPAWHPDSDRLAYSSSVDNIGQVFTITVPSGTPVSITSEEVYAGQPTWSPDGTKLAYVAERDDNFDVWVLDLVTSEATRLTTDPEMDWAPAWSPDGSRLAFVSQRGGNHQIYLMRPDGSELRQLTSEPQGAESPAWSPNSLWLAYVAYTGSGSGVDAREIYLMRADGHDQTRLTYNGHDDAQPTWRWP